MKFNTAWIRTRATLVTASEQIHRKVNQELKSRCVIKGVGDWKLLKEVSV